MYKLTEKRAADRKKMAGMVEELAKRYGWQAEYSEFNTTTETRIELTGPRGLSVGVEFESKPCMPDNYCLAWNFLSSNDDDALLSDAFGRYQGSPVNGTHRRKCTAFARGIDTLMDKLETAFLMAVDQSPFGNAFMPPPAFIMKNHKAYHPGEAWHYMLYDENMEKLCSKVMLPDEAREFAKKHSLQSISPYEMQKMGGVKS